tara:strand:- start:4574 stop:4762 length:189 start_codon:yes stop_codon:yes gene_type:complete
MPQFLDPEADELAPNDLSKLEETVQAVLRLAAIAGKSASSKAPPATSLKDALAGEGGRADSL